MISSGRVSVKLADATFGLHRPFLAPPPDALSALPLPPPLPPPPEATISCAALLISANNSGLISASRSNDTLSSSSTPSLCASSNNSCICRRSSELTSKLPSAFLPIPTALALASASDRWASTTPSASTKHMPMSSQFCSENSLHTLHVSQTLRSLARCSSDICSNTTGIHVLASDSMRGMNLPRTFLRSESTTYTSGSLFSLGTDNDISGLRMVSYRALAILADAEKSSATIDRLLIFNLSG
mmetsp:Transcript_21621/g.62035  ORF Transcript_21621/g.62035 Transcript_21621/m.62035 type:complete len:243 (-) Transcript_21621:307-1035(-)